MIHDYSHCLDYTDQCPENCFRAKLTKKAIEEGFTVSWQHFGHTYECPIAATEGDEWKRKN